MRKIAEAFSKGHAIRSFFYTAGYPKLDSTLAIARALQEGGAEMIELGFPYSDPLADGPTVQRSNEVAIKNGMTLPVLFEQLTDLRKTVQIPLLLMGYLNPVMLYGVEKFLLQCQRCGVNGIIIPDLPLQDYERDFLPHLQKLDLACVFLVTPASSDQRIREIDSHSRGFIYAVSSFAVTGQNLQVGDQQKEYLVRLKRLKLKNPIVVGFGIATPENAGIVAEDAAGFIVGSALLRALADSSDVVATSREFARRFS